MKPISFISFIALSTLLLGGCTVDELFNSGSGENNTISFATQMPATRSAAYEETGPNAYKSMGVYATINSGSNLMANQQVTRSDHSNGWSYTPLQQWPANDIQVSFYAYAPYNAVAPTQEIGKIPVVHNYTVAATNDGKAEDQIDLLLAEAVTDTRDSTTTDVHLNMRHILTRVLFSARTQNPYAPGVSIQITKIQLTGLQNQGTHRLDAREYWTATSTNALVSNTYELTTAGDGLTNTVLNHSNYIELNQSAGNLFLMPQVLTNTTAQLAVTVNTTGGGQDKEDVYTFPLIDLLDEFKQGEALRFLLTVPNAANPEEFKISVQHADWNAEYNIDADIERDPVLYISNETVYAYDGAVTCVYFSSNIPPHAANHPTDPNGFNDIIYIEDQGRVGTNTGATFSVAEEFYAIAKNDANRQKIKLDQPGAHINNLRYESDGTGLYKGHLDIVQLKTTAAGETANEGKQPLILKLHVGKLVRDITVQRVVTTEAAKQNPTRYVGTFHRHHETGERIVTWYEDENTRWRVEIDGLGQPDDIAQLQIDTRISPDFRNKQLYSLVARDPEGTRVEQNDNLFGRGRVYFRVGWKTPTNGIKNRYARIKVKLWKNGKMPTDANGNEIGADDTHYLYCRQGETEERIASADSRYALFNVLTPGEFVRYPTQTGMLYQWNRLVPWSPLGDAPPYGWNSNLNDYEASFDYQRSACPDGYVYPSETQRIEMTAVFGDGVSGTPTARGYYADGYFDRRAITYNGPTSAAKNEHRVNASNIEVAAVGTILFNNGNLGYPTGNARSIFLVSGGYRNVDVVNYGGLDGGLIANEGHGANHGVHGGYWFDIPGAKPEEAFSALIFSGTTKDYIKPYSKRNAHSLRCIRENSWLFVFNANGGENGPRNMTIPKSESSIAIPNIVPNNYYRDNYEFQGWTVNKNGSGTLYKAGQSGIALETEFGAPTNPAKRVELYAKWELPATKVNFLLISGVNTSYFLAANTLDPYVELTTTNNGTSYNASLSFVNYVQGADKAYPILEFSELLPSTNWNAAYNACLAMGTGWRLPRVQEVAMLFEYRTKIGTVLVDKLLGKVSETDLGTIWTGTNSTTTGNALRSYRVSLTSNHILNLSKGNTASYRCVRASAP